MSANSEKYSLAFVEAFGVDVSAVESLEYQKINEWDSVGHMGLIAQLEEAFNIQIAMDDVIEFGSFEKGKVILGKYGITF